jgi:hypothetical protein
MSFTNILLHNLSNPKKISISLNPNEIRYIKKMVDDHPEIFDKISIQINALIQEKTLGIHDLPQIIIIISREYKIMIPDTKVDIINIVQYTIDSILDCDLIPFLEIEESIVKKIVDSSINLLRMNIKKEEEICCNFIDNYIKCALNLDSI